MLQLKNIKKDYVTGDTTVHALKGVDIRFRKSEFVAILGQSGCGKTTLLNIIGGLDRYTEGDLFIAGRSTKEFKDADWDSYRNHSIGFVFQSYNLIPHQTVLSNVELALTLSGVPKSERRKRAKEALEQVGLGDQLYKKPNQMSGGQMQRVAIARALVNDPQILLADEPTGALDSATSVQIMDILREIAKDRLIIMVTHNPELADEYATRTVRLLDGEIVSDSDPYEVAEFDAVKADAVKKEVKKPKKTEKQKKVSMSFLTALSLSLNNLMTKKARTALTAFAGSIGIIGIALILALSNGIQGYIQSIQEDTLSSYPITLNREEADISSLITSISGVRAQSGKDHANDAVYSSSVMYELINSMLNTETKKNDLAGFKSYLEKDETIRQYISAIKYTYDVDLNVYAKDLQSGKYVNAKIEELMTTVSGANSAFTGMYSQFAGVTVFEEMLPGEKDSDGGYSGDGYVSDMLRDQYDLIYGSWPTKANELVLVLDERNEITDITQFALGLVSAEEMREITLSAMKGTPIEIVDRKWSYEEICNLSLKLVLSCDQYKDTNGDGIYEDITEDDKLMDLVVSSALDLKVSGIIRKNAEATSTALRGSIGYTAALTEYIIEETAKNELVKLQNSKEYENVDVFSGLPFVVEELEELTQAQQAQTFLSYVEGLSDADKAALYSSILSTPKADVLQQTVNSYLERYPDRAAQEAFILEQYAAGSGYDEDMVREYLASYTDEDLLALITQGIEQMITAQYEQTAKEMLESIAAAPTAEELQGIIQPILAGLPDREAKEFYIAADWSKKTGMAPASILAYLKTLPDAELETKLMELVQSVAVSQYGEYSGYLTDDVKNQKIAAALNSYLEALSEEEQAYHYQTFMPAQISESTLQDNLARLGVADLSSPSAINIYAATFEDKDAIASEIEAYNSSVSEEEQISYTDYVALLMSSVTKIVDFVSYGLIAFVSISLVVSSIMIGIITYISVLERTKEIGILRSIGASKRNISTVFNAETLMIGFASGSFGILATLVISIPVNAIMKHLTDVSNIAKLPWEGAVILILISMVLTVLSGLIPAYFASKKDPVVALRTE